MMKVDVYQIKKAWFRKAKTVITVQMDCKADLDKAIDAVLWLQDNKQLVKNLPNTPNKHENNRIKAPI